MSTSITVTVGPICADFIGQDHLALQAAVDYVARYGGGTVRILPGTYEMGNSLFLRHRIHLVGEGDDTVLRKYPSASTRLTDDIDWYGTVVKVESPSIFKVGGGLLLRGKSPFTGQAQFVKRTVTAIEGDSIHIDKDPRLDFWIDAEAEAATLFPVITGDYVNDIVIEDLRIDGNRAENERLDGNYGGGIFLQDCDRIAVRNVITHDNHGDGISWQVCDDVLIEGCRSLNNADLGLHPGSGSQRPIVRNNTIRGNGTGFFFCWGVRDGLVEGNTIEDSLTYGISIGHRDTDNIIRSNRVRRSGIHGILFREHPVSLRDPHRNVFEENLIEDCGGDGECVAIEMLGAAEDVILRRNRIADTRPSSGERKRIGLRIGAKTKGLKLEGNEFIGLEKELTDLREG